MRTTLAVETATRDRLLGLKQSWGLASVEEVIIRFLDGAPLGARALYESRRDPVDAAVARHGITCLVAFGSRARGDARPDSDLDLLADLPEDGGLLAVVRAQDDLADAFGVPVQLLTPGAVHGRIKEHIEREGVVLVP